MLPSLRRIAFAILATSAVALLPSASAQTFTWSGSGGNDLFGNGANWVGGGTPSVGSGVILNFTGATRPNPSNDYTTGDNFGEWWLLSGAASDFAVGGNGFGLFGKIENQAGSGRLFTINTAGIYARDGSIEINPVGGNIVVGAAIELDGNASLNVYDGSNGRTLTINGSLSNGNGTGGDGSLILNQTATVILAGANDYGATTLNAGTTLKVGTGSTAGTLGSGAVTNNGTLDFNRSDSVTISNAISGTGTVIQNGTGTVAFSNQKSYSGGTTVNGGILDLTGGGGSGGTIRGTVTVNSGATLRFSSGDVTGYGTGADRLATINLVGGTMNVNTASNQTLGNATINMTGASITGIAGSNLDFFQTSSALNTLASATTSTISGTKVQIRQTAGVTFTVATGTTASGIDLDVSSVISNNGSFTAAPLIKAGAGTMRISATNTLSGPTNVTGGKLIVSGSNGLLNTSSLEVTGGATLELGATNIFVSGHGVALANSRVITVTGSTLLMNGNFDARFGNVTLGNGATWTSNRGLTAYDALLANTSAGAATVTIANTGGNTTASVMNGTGGIHLGGVQNFDVADVTGSTAVDLTVGMILDNGGLAGGTGGVNKLGAGTMSLTNYNTYSGGTTVAAGVLDLTGGGGVTGTIRGGVTVNTGATLRLSVNDATGYGTGADRISAITLNEGGTLHIATTGGAGQNQTFSNMAITMTGATISGVAGANIDLFNNGTSVTTNASATISTISVPKLGLRQSGTTFTVANGAAAVDLLVSAVMSDSSGEGNNALIKEGAGVMKLIAANTYTGSTTVSGGTLEAAVAGALGSTAGVVVTSGGTLLLSGAGDRISDTAPFTLAGGTFSIGGLSETVGALTLSDDSIIDFGAGAAILSFADSTGLWTPGKILSIYNWSGLTVTGGGDDQLRFASNGLNAAQLSQINFYSDAGATKLSITPALFNGFVGGAGEVAPVPEPSTIVAALGLLGVIGLRGRRRH